MEAEGRCKFEKGPHFGHAWYLYYRLNKKNAIHDEEKGIEETKHTGIEETKHTFCLFIIFSLVSLVSKYCTIDSFRLLYNKLRKKEPIYDEEKAIEKSEPKPKPSTPATTLRVMPDTEKTMIKATKKTPLAKKTKDKKETKKKKKASLKLVDESIKGEAIEVPSIKQSTDEPMQSAQSPQIFTIPTETKDKKKKLTKKKKRASVKSVEKSMKGKAIEVPTIKQSTDEPMQSDQSPQILTIPTESVTVIQPEQQPTVPLREEYVPPANILSMEQENVASDSVSVSPNIPDFHQPVVKSKTEPSSNTKLKRIIIVTWIDEITDDEDDEASAQKIMPE
ncbi:protein mel-28-like [Xenopus laevis]|uniref:Protein mel-28-like n=1 Tax=Xenopus laevis TaxID=8355 RepID=A0A8J1MYP0_XENLA|nr:protein mel-28-like [Xenopus laevis]